jgi:hypothetical protein
MSTQWRGSTEGPRSMSVPSTWAPVQAWPVARGPAPLRAHRARRGASTRAGDRSNPWQVMRSRDHQGKSGIGTSNGGSSRVAAREAYEEMLCTQDRPVS